MCGIGDQWNKAAAREQGDPEETIQPEALIIFVKNPVKGKVKTRLAATIGDDAALEAYMQMLAHTRDVAMSIDAARYLFYTQFVDPDDAWPNHEFRKALQPDGDLGEKMEAAFRRTFEAGHSRVIIIGSDCLDLRPAHLQEAFTALKTHDFVLGPANDGGYYLLGMRQLTPALFHNKQWSTETVAAHTLRDMDAAGGSVHMLPELSDIDYEADLAAARARRND